MNYTPEHIEDCKRLAELMDVVPHCNSWWGAYIKDFVGNCEGVPYVMPIDHGRIICYLPPLSWLVRELFQACRDISTDAEFYEWDLSSNNVPEYVVTITETTRVVVENREYRFDKNVPPMIEATEEGVWFSASAPTPEGK